MMAQTALEKKELQERDALARLHFRPTIEKNWHCEVCAYIFGVNYTDKYWRSLEDMQKTMLMELGWNSFTFDRVRAFVESIPALTYFERMSQLERELEKENDL